MKASDQKWQPASDCGIVSSGKEEHVKTPKYVNCPLPASVRILLDFRSVIPKEQNGFAVFIYLSVLSNHPKIRIASAASVGSDLFRSECFLIIKSTD